MCATFGLNLIDTFGQDGPFGTCAQFTPLGQNCHFAPFAPVGTFDQFVPFDQIGPFGHFDKYGTFGPL